MRQLAERPDRRHPGLDLDDEPAFQRRLWALERGSWAGIALLLLGALLGLFGSAGPLGDAVAESTDAGLRLRYARFARHSAPTTFKIELGPEVTTGERVQVVVSRAFLEGTEVSAVLPEPETVELGEEELVYAFSVARRGAAVAITFEFEPGRYARQHGWVGLPDGPRLHVSQFVYP